MLKPCSADFAERPTTTTGGRNTSGMRESNGAYFSPQSVPIAISDLASFRAVYGQDIANGKRNLEKLIYHIAD
jgi:hypothetical protein